MLEQFTQYNGQTRNTKAQVIRLDNKEHVSQWFTETENELFIHLDYLATRPNTTKFALDWLAENVSLKTPQKANSERLEEKVEIPTETAKTPDMPQELANLSYKELVELAKAKGHEFKAQPKKADVLKLLQEDK